MEASSSRRRWCRRGYGEQVRERSASGAPFDAVGGSAWLSHPHPDLADAYAHVKLGDIPRRQRLVRIETLAARRRSYRGRARHCAAAIDRIEFAPRGAALAPFIAAPPSGWRC